MSTLTREVMILKLVILTQLLIRTSSLVIYITPATQTVPCPQKEPCCTLAEYSLSYPRENNTKLILLPGVHILNNSLVFENLVNISLSGVLNKYSQSVLKFGENGRLVFDAVRNCVIHNISFTETHDGSNKAIAFVNSQNISIANVKVTAMSSSNSYGGAMRIESCNNITISNTKYLGNRASSGGGALYILDSHMSIINCSFLNNSARNFGGAILVTSPVVESVLHIYSSFFIGNRAGNSGGAISVLNGRIVISQCAFDGNNATRYGGSVYIRAAPADTGSTVFTLSVLNSHFVNGEALSGGAVVMLGGNSYIGNSSFRGNHALWGGGALYVYQSTLLIAFTVLSSNSAYQSPHDTTYGGAMYIGQLCSVLIIKSLFMHNYGNGLGGAIYSGPQSSLNASESQFRENYNLIDSGTENGGGALSLSGDSYVFVKCGFSLNTARQGGAIFDFFGKSVQIISCIFDGNTARSTGGALNLCELCTVVMEQTHFVRNTANIGGAIFAQGSRILSNSYLNFNNNSCESFAVVYLHYCEVSFNGNWVFVNNTGSLFAFATGITFKNKAVFIDNKPPSLNTSDEGGAATFLQSNVIFSGTLLMSHNQAKQGGAMLISDTNLFIPINAQVKLSDNTAVLSGGAVHCFQCQLRFGAEILITRNQASENGGGLLAISSTIKISTNRVVVSHNRAKLGGGIHMRENSLIIIRKIQLQISAQNFLEFSGNMADYGGALYVEDDTNSGVCGSNSTTSSQGNCFLQILRLFSSSQLLSQNGRHQAAPFQAISFSNNTARHSGNSLHGGLLDRCSLSIFSEILDYPRVSFDNALTALTATASWDKLRPIASNPIRVCFCESGKNTSYNCRATHPAVHVRRGHSFKLYLVAVDQALNSLSANILVTVFSNAGLKEGQTNQTVHGECTALEYNIYSPNDFEEMTVYAEGPCLSKGLSQLKIQVVFDPCTCIVGFQPSNSSRICECVCDKRLSPFITNCTSNQTIYKERDLWVSYSNETNTDGFLVYEFCPYDYCKSIVNGPVALNLSTQDGVDQQCAFHRAGKLCGSCSNGYSLAFGSSECLECTNHYIALLIPFALAGIILVFFLLACNLTVAIGSINGLVFYANIVLANRSVFLPARVPAVLSVFIAWINLDVGIEMCFYNGMSMYAKTLLQLVFPTYVLLLVMALIVICEYSKRFAALIGKKNPVATLATLILLSYAKFLRIIITGLSFGRLQLPDGSWEIVWLPDANVPFLAKEHAPRFVAVSVITAAALVYIVLLLFEKCFRRCSKWRGMKWLNSTKLHGFMDAYYAPFNPQHCYWVGLLLLIRVLLFIHTVGFNSEPTLEHKATMLAIIGAVFLLLLLKQLKVRIYKSWINDLLETAFLINLGIFAAGTYHILSTRTDGQQFVLAILSVSIALLTFSIICAYHTWTFILPNSRLKKFVCSLFSRSRPSASVSECYEVLQGVSYVSLDSEQQSFENDAGLLREPDLDILAPVTKHDFHLQVYFQQHEASPDASPTCSVIEGRPPRKAIQLKQNQIIE